MSRARAAALTLALAGSVTCGGTTVKATRPERTASAPASMRIMREPGRPALAIVTRQGDPSSAVAAFVSTAGIGTRGSVVQTALAGIFEARLEGARVTPQDGGVRVVMPMADPRDLTRLAAALLESVAADVDLTTVKRKLAALGALPRPLPEVARVAACEGALVAPTDLSIPSASDLESWRKAAVVSERVGFGVVGAVTVEHAPALPEGPSLAEPSDDDDPPLVVYDASSEPAWSGARPGTSMVDITWRGELSLLGVARALGTPRSRFDAMLVASDPGAHVRAVTATLSPRGVCLSVRAELDEGGVSGGAPRVAALVALATKEVSDAVTEDNADALASSTALEAAEQAAVIALAPFHRSEGARPSHERIPRVSAPHIVVGMPSPTASAHDTLAAAIESSSRAWESRVIEARTRIESGQPAPWMLIASPCGTAGETDADAGASAAFAVAIASMAARSGLNAQPWLAEDGIGVLASDRDARKLADVLARSFVVDPIEEARSAEGLLLEGVHPALAALAQAIAEGRPASVLPTGTSYGLLRLSDAAIIARADALRLGPLRVAVIANVDAAQADAAVARADRWLARDRSRACPAQAAASKVKPGTYAVVTDDGSSEAYIAAMVPSDMESAAALIAGALDGPRGLLEKALGDGLARSSAARTLGLSGARAIVIHIEAPSSALDAAVAQTRALLDRLRQGAWTDDDVARAKQQEALLRAARLADPQQRLIALFRGEGAASTASVAEVRATSAAVLRDELLVIVAARPRATQKARTP